MSNLSIHARATQAFILGAIEQEKGTCTPFALNTEAVELIKGLKVDGSSLAITLSYVNGMRSIKEILK